MTRSKKLMLCIEYDTRTRWLCRDEELSTFVRRITSNVVTSVTSGPSPQITVTLEEQPEIPVPAVTAG